MKRLVSLVSALLILLAVLLIFFLRGNDFAKYARYSSSNFNTIPVSDHINQFFLYSINDGTLVTQVLHTNDYSMLQQYYYIKIKEKLNAMISQEELNQLDYLINQENGYMGGNLYEPITLLLEHDYYDEEKREELLHYFDEKYKQTIHLSDSPEMAYDIFYLAYALNLLQKTDYNHAIHERFSGILHSCEKTSDRLNAAYFATHFYDMLGQSLPDFIVTPILNDFPKFIKDNNYDLNYLVAYLEVLEILDVEVDQEIETMIMTIQRDLKELVQYNLSLADVYLALQLLNNDLGVTSQLLNKIEYISQQNNYKYPRHYQQKDNLIEYILLRIMTVHMPNKDKFILPSLEMRAKEIVLNDTAIDIYYKILFKELVSFHEFSAQEEEQINLVLSSDDNIYYSFWSYKWLKKKINNTSFEADLREKITTAFLNDGNIIEQLRSLDMLLELDPTSDEVQQYKQMIDREIEIDPDILVSPYNFYLYNLINTKINKSPSYTADDLERIFLYKNISGQDIIVNSQFMMDLTGYFLFANMQSILNAESKYTSNLNIR